MVTLPVLDARLEIANRLFVFCATLGLIDFLRNALGSSGTGFKFFMVRVRCWRAGADKFLDTMSDDPACETWAYIKK